LPEFEVSSLSINYDRDYRNDIRARFQISQDLRSDSTRLGASVSKLFKSYDIALDTFYDTKTQDYSIGVRIGFSLGRNPISGDFIQRRLGLAQGGGVAARVFKDLNGNNIFDAGDEVVSNARVTSSGSSVGVTDENGIAFIGNIGENRRVAIGLDQTSLDNIYLQPTRPRYEILPRAGRIHETNIALLETGEIEGDIRFVDRSGTRAVSAVRFNVYNYLRQVVTSGRSESDGYFLVESLPVGSYSIELDPDQANRLNIKLSSPATFVIRPGGESGPRLRLEVQRR
jgi:hypothetical protein